MLPIRSALLVLVSSVLSAIAAQLPTVEPGDLNKLLSATPGPELPAQAAEAVRNAPQQRQLEVAQAIVQLVAQKRAASLIPVLASIASVAPETAANVAALAAKALPAQAEKLASAAAHAAPSFAPQINHAVAAQVPGMPLLAFKGNPPPKDPPPNRPITTPGNENGNRPEVPPGHVRDPKPGRDDQHHYGRP